MKFIITVKGNEPATFRVIGSASSNYATAIGWFKIVLNLQIKSIMISHTANIIATFMHLLKCAPYY